jgi:hypothetical protein
VPLSSHQRRPARPPPDRLDLSEPRPHPRNAQQRPSPRPRNTRVAIRAPRPNQPPTRPFQGPHRRVRIQIIFLHTRCRRIRPPFPPPPTHTHTHPYHELQPPVPGSTPLQPCSQGGPRPRQHAESWRSEACARPCARGPPPSLQLQLPPGSLPQLPPSASLSPLDRPPPFSHVLGRLLFCSIL